MTLCCNARLCPAIIHSLVLFVTAIPKPTTWRRGEICPHLSTQRNHLKQKKHEKKQHKTEASKTRVRRRCDDALAPDHLVSHLMQNFYGLAVQILIQSSFSFFSFIFFCRRANSGTIAEILSNGKLIQNCRNCTNSNTLVSPPFYVKMPWNLIWLTKCFKVLIQLCA